MMTNKAVKVRMYRPSQSIFSAPPITLLKQGDNAHAQQTT
jgi:hypothetical protein